MKSHYVVAIVVSASIFFGRSTHSAEVAADTTLPRKRLPYNEPFTTAALVMESMAAAFPRRFLIWRRNRRNTSNCSYTLLRTRPALIPTPKHTCGEWHPN